MYCACETRGADERRGGKRRTEIGEGELRERKGDATRLVIRRLLARSRARATSRGRRAPSKEGLDQHLLFRECRLFSRQGFRPSGESWKRVETRRDLLDAPSHPPRPPQNLFISGDPSFCVFRGRRQFRNPSPALDAPQPGYLEAGALDFA